MCEIQSIPSEYHLFKKGEDPLGQNRLSISVTGDNVKDLYFTVSDIQNNKSIDFLLEELEILAINAKHLKNLFERRTKCEEVE